MLDIQEINEKTILQSRNYMLKSEFFGKKEIKSTENRMGTDEKKHIQNIYN